MQISDIARTDVVTVDIETTLPEVAHVMRDERVGSVVVTDGKGGVAGILTDRDVVTYGLTRDEDPRRIIANAILARHVFSVAPTDDVRDVIRQMREERVRRVPLVADGDLVGIVTLDDLVCHLADEGRALAEQFADLGAVIEAESPERA
jgi:CBS domain-containing protein